MPRPGRKRPCSRASSIASPKRKYRPPLQLPIAFCPGAGIARNASGRAWSALVAVARGLGLAAVAGVRVVLALLAGADADLLGLLLLRRLARLDDLQLQRALLVLALLVAIDRDGGAGRHLARLQHLVGERVLDVA